MSYNPFITGPMIKNSAYFVGRFRESVDILAKIHTNTSVSVVGEKRIGKSSLLYYLYNCCKTQFKDRRVAYLDFLNAEMKTLEGFVELLLAHLRIKYEDEAALKADPNTFLTRRLRQLYHNNELPPIVFLDEFDKIEELPDFFNIVFLGNLRALCNEGHICLVTASDKPLREIMDRGSFASHYSSIFTLIPLQEFVVETDLDERGQFLIHYWCGVLAPTVSEMRFLLSYTSTHPLVMQIVSFNVCQNRYLSIKRSDNQLCEIIEQQIKSCFYDSRDDIRKWLYNTKIILPKNIKWEIEFISKILKNLNPLKDLKIIG